MGRRQRARPVGTRRYSGVPFFLKDQCFLKQRLFFFPSSMFNKCLLTCHPEVYLTDELL